MTDPRTPLAVATEAVKAARVHARSAREHAEVAQARAAAARRSYHRSLIAVGIAAFAAVAALANAALATWGPW